MGSLAGASEPSSKLRTRTFGTSVSAGTAGGGDPAKLELATRPLTARSAATTASVLTVMPRDIRSAIPVESAYPNPRNAAGKVQSRGVTALGKRGPSDLHRHYVVAGLASHIAVTQPGQLEALRVLFAAALPLLRPLRAVTRSSPRRATGGHPTTHRPLSQRAASSSLAAAARLPRLPGVAAVPAAERADSARAIVGSVPERTTAPATSDG